MDILVHHLKALKVHCKLLNGSHIGHRVLKVNHRSNSISFHFFFIFFLIIISREWKFAHPMSRVLDDDDDEDKEKIIIEKKQVRFLFLSNCASFLLGMGM